MTDKHALRRQARSRRRGLDAAYRQHASEQAASTLLEQIAQHGWRRIAAYAATASELDLSTFFSRCPPQVELYLPGIDREGCMTFRLWHANSALSEGPHGIRQPDENANCGQVTALDALLLPLLAYDRHGTRLGSGAGYYDRALANRLHRASPPLLIGIAFSAQQFDALPREPWDVPLDAVITEHGWLDLPATMAGSTT